MYQGKPCNGRIKQRVFHFDNIDVELIQPYGEEDSFWRDCLKKQGEGLHHIAVEACGTKDVLAQLNENGIVTFED